MSNALGDGGPAFPGLSDDYRHQTGMTLRDYFAGQILAGFVVVAQNGPVLDTSWERLAMSAYRGADAMLKARAQ